MRKKNMYWRFFWRWWYWEPLSCFIIVFSLGIWISYPIGFSLFTIPHPYPQSLEDIKIIVTCKEQAKHHSLHFPEPNSLLTLSHQTLGSRKGASDCAPLDCRGGSTTRSKMAGKWNDLECVGTLKTRREARKPGQSQWSYLKSLWGVQDSARGWHWEGEIDGCREEERFTGLG